MIENFSLKNPSQELFQAHRTVILADQNVASLYGEDLAGKINASLLIVPRGEKAKTRRVKERIEDAMLEMGCGKDTLLIGLGGGSTTDLAGFIASTYLRGIPLILIPTTLLAIVDAAIGGKTGVNTALGKNLIGTFYPAKKILVDLDVLKSLPKKERFNGMSEMLKMKLVFDATLDCEDVLRAAAAKEEIVRQDPFEKGRRRILNFGHTIAHALETASSYQISHGEAVAIGCMTESFLSRHLGFLDDFESVASLYQNFRLRLPKSYQREALLKAFSFDKKKEKGALRFVLIERIGQAISFDGAWVREVSLDELTPALEWMEKTYGDQSAALKVPHDASHPLCSDGKRRLSH